MDDTGFVSKSNYISHFLSKTLQNSFTVLSEKDYLLPKAYAGRTDDSSEILAKNQSVLDQYSGVTWDPTRRKTETVAAQYRAVANEPVVKGGYDPGSSEEIIFQDTKVR